MKQGTHVVVRACIFYFLKYCRPIMFSLHNFVTVCYFVVCRPILFLNVMQNAMLIVTNPACKL